MRLINEDDVLRIVERVTNEAVERNQRKYLIQPRIIAEIAGLPTIEAEPVVRCKDCKYRQDDDFCGGRGWPAQLVPDDGYCDRGARIDADKDNNVRNLTDEETAIYESWIESEARDTDVNLMGGDGDA